jgi:hypothetical protein
MNEDMILSVDTIKDRIHTIRNVQVILDRDLAEIYDVETRVLNQAVKRNIERFPLEFMFQLSKKEFNDLKPRIINLRHKWMSQNVISN